MYQIKHYFDFSNCKFTHSFLISAIWRGSPCRRSSDDANTDWVHCLSRHCRVKMAWDLEPTFARHWECVCDRGNGCQRCADVARRRIASWVDDTWTRHRSPLPTAMLVWYGEQPWGITPLAGSQGRTQDLPRGKPVTWPLGHGSCIEEVPYCFSKSSINFKGHKGKKITYFDPNFGVSGL